MKDVIEYSRLIEKVKSIVRMNVNVENHTEDIEKRLEKL